MGFFVIGKRAAQNAVLGLDGLTQCIFKVASLLPGLRHQRHHAPTVAHDMRQLLLSADFAVGHIQEIVLTGNLAQGISEVSTCKGSSVRLPG